MSGNQDKMNTDAGKNNAIPVHFVSRDKLSNDEQFWTDKGNAAAQDGNYEDAVDAFAQAVSLSPDNARVRYNLAQAQRYLGYEEMAVAGYRRALDLDPQMLDAYIDLGNLYSDLGLHEEALETFQQALELEPDNDELYLSLGDAYRAQHLYQDAIQAYRQTLLLNPENSAASDNLRDTRERVNEQWLRVIDKERKIDENPADPARYAALASLYLDMQRYDDALNAANSMLTLESGRRPGYDMLVAIYKQMGERDQVAEMYVQIVAMDPDDAEAWEDLGFWRSLQEQKDVAIDAYSHALTLDPQRTTASFGLAETYLEAERYDDALPIYQNLVDSTVQVDDQAAAYAGLAETYNALARYDDAIQTAQALLKRSEDDPEGYYQLAIAYDAQGQYDEAIESYQNAIESAPLNVDYYNDYASTLCKAKRYDEALDVAQQAIAMDSSMISAYETMAQIYQETNRPEEAAAITSQINALHAVSEGGLPL